MLDNIIYGYIAVAVACLFFGSFGVPIKSEASMKVDIDPLVFQSYKTLMCFLTCWLIMFFETEFYFTPWGIISGLFWVPSGVTAIIAVKSAGLALSQGLWSSLIVLVSFSWGIAIFHEEVKSLFGAVIAVLLMILGLCGMSYFSSPSATKNISFHPVSTELVTMTEERTIDEHQDNLVTDEYVRKDENEFQVSKRKIGILAAMFNGMWGGSILVPMHYSSKETKGLSYVISFAIGSTLITVLLWLIRLLFYSLHFKSFYIGYQRLPSFHLKTMWLPGGLSGLLWSVGNICSIISVSVLGEAIGYSVIQGSILISGLWGIFWFKEIEGFYSILLWLSSATITVIGIILLSYEHK